MNPTEMTTAPHKPDDEGALTPVPQDNQQLQAMSSALVSLGQIESHVEMATTIPEIKNSHDTAEAIRTLLQKAKCSLQVQNRAAEIKLWAEWKGGRMLADINRQQRGRPKKMSNDASFLPKLEDLGLNKDISSRWQKIAGLDEIVLREHINAVNAEGKELTTAGALKLAKKLTSDKAKGNQISKSLGAPIDDSTPSDSTDIDQGISTCRSSDGREERKDVCGDDMRAIFPNFDESGVFEDDVLRMFKALGTWEEQTSCNEKIQKYMKEQEEKRSREPDTATYR